MIPTSRTGLFIIRAWLDPDSSSPLRVQMTVKDDVNESTQSQTTITDATGVCQAVEKWLEDLLAGSTLE